MPKVSLLLFNVTLLLLATSASTSASCYINADDSAKTKQGQPVIQTATNSVTDTGHNTPAPVPFILNPIIGAGVGMLSYFGNVKYVKSDIQNPTTSRLGYTLMFGQKINDHIEFDLNGIFGLLGQYERSATYNWNFESQIAGGGAYVMYKILPDKPITPFFTLGLESFNFLSKTDMKDKYGNKYYYWSDGSMRSLPQNAADASTAAILTPDYTYETDIRSLDLDGTGKYSQQTFAVPIGAGLIIHIGKKAEFTVGTTLHYTFTDHIDGLTPGVQGPLHGTKKNDMFLLTAVGLRYDLTSLSKLNGEHIDESRYDSVKFDASFIQDTVRPANGDTVPINDSLARRRYLAYKDSTGKYGKMIYDSSGAKSGVVNKEYASLPSASSPASGGREYTVELGKYSKGVPASQMDKMLSVPDVKSNVMKDSSSVYTAGNYSDLEEAKKRKAELTKQGFNDAKIVYRKGNDFIDVDKQNTGDEGSHAVAVENPQITKTTTEKVKTETSTDVGGVVYRVQLGAFKNKLTNTRMFKGAKNVIEIKTENGLYTYSVGSFTAYSDAVASKTELAAGGYPDAFVKAYRNGKRITLAEAGAAYVKPVNNEPAPKEDNKQAPKEAAAVAPVNKDGAAINKKDIKFKVQLGVYKGTPPMSIRSKFKKYSNLAFDEDNAGNVHYNVGPYSDYESAKAEKEKAIASGIKGAFVVAFYKDKPIPVQQAVSMLKQ